MENSMIYRENFDNILVNEGRIMNYLKRAIINVKRNPMKSISLFILIFVLGSLIIGAISIHQAVENTEANLRSQLPAVASITIDSEAIAQHTLEMGIEHYELVTEWITPELVSEIAVLAELQAYEFSLQTNVVTRGLNAVFVPSVTEMEVGEVKFRDILLNDISFRGFGVEAFDNIPLHGVHRYPMANITSEVISIISGAPFTQQQLDYNESVALVSNVFADENNLQVGSIINLNSIIFDMRDILPNTGPEDWYTEVNVQIEKTWEITVVGIFELAQEFDYFSGDYWMSAMQESLLQNRIYLPNILVNEIASFTIYWSNHYNPIHVLGSEEQINFRNLFLLENPRDMNYFINSAQELLPEFWIMGDLSNTFRNMTASMDMILWIADLILYAAIGAIIVITSLLIILFLRDRRYEIGIYLALGAKKGEVVAQILLEVLLVSVIAMIFAVFAGTLISVSLTNQMLETQILQQQDEIGEMNPWIEIPTDLQIFNPREFSAEQMMEAFDISLDATTLTVFFAVGFGALLISTTVPILYIVRLKPKKILL